MTLDGQIAIASALLLAGALAVFWRNHGVEYEVNQAFARVDSRLGDFEKVLKRAHDELWGISERAERKAGFKEAEKRIAAAVGDLLGHLHQEHALIKREKDG